MLRPVLFIAVLFGVEVASAQESPPNPYAEIDVVMRAQAINQRCHLLRYYETILVDDGATRAAKKTPEVVAALAGAGSAEAANTMMDVRREKARADVAERSCSENHPELAIMRNSYIPSILRYILATSAADADDQVPSAMLKGRAFLYAHIERMLGDAMPEVGAALTAEIQMAPMPGRQAWSGIQPIVLNAMWERTLLLNDHNFQPHPQKRMRFEFQPTEDNVAAVSGSFLKSRAEQIRDSDGNTILISRSIGVDSEDHLMLVVATHEEGAIPLASEVLVQTEPGSMDRWFAEDWRLHTIRFQGISIPAESCPADHCFRFPKAASEAIRERLDSEAADTYFLEIAIASPEQIPVSNYSSATDRVTLNPAVFD